MAGFSGMFELHGFGNLDPCGTAIGIKQGGGPPSKLGGGIVVSCGGA